MKRTILFVGILAALLFAGSAQATLFDRGNGLIYDDVLNITWTQNANLCVALNNCISSTNGSMLLPNAVSWANNLVFGGFDDWRLARVSNTPTWPSSGPFPVPFNCDYTVGSTAAQCAASGNELGYMYYFNLGGGGFPGHTGTQTADGVTLNNIQNIYWTGNSCGVTGNFYYSFDDGHYTGIAPSPPNIPTEALYAWAVRPGDSLALPEPGTLWLLGVGLVGLVAVRRQWTA